MDLETYVSTIVATSKSDWEVIHSPVFLQNLATTGRNQNHLGLSEHYQLMVLKSELSISIAIGLERGGAFIEDWATKFPNPQASSDWVDMLWDGRPVRRELRVLVDGARCGLPVPEPGMMGIPARKVQFFQLVDNLVGGHEFDHYFELAGMSGIEQPWP